MLKTARQRAELQGNQNQQAQSLLAKLEGLLREVIAQAEQLPHHQLSQLIDSARRNLQTGRELIGSEPARALTLLSAARDDWGSLRRWVSSAKDIVDWEDGFDPTWLILGGILRSGYRPPGTGGYGRRTVTGSWRQGGFGSQGGSGGMGSK